MDKREALKSMLNNLINDKPEEATLDFHNYVTAKMKDVAGISAGDEEVPAEVDGAVEVATADADETPAGDTPPESAETAAE